MSVHKRVTYSLTPSPNLTVSPPKMRRAPPSTHFLATATMSSRPQHRGRGRGFSGRPYSAARDQYVTGDSHFRSVRDANSGIRRGSFANQTQYNQNPPRSYPPPPTQFRPPNHRPAFRPKPPDYREWELALTPPPPPHCERFIVLSYNILADYLAMEHWRKLYSHIPRYMLDWQWRKNNIVFELGLWSADIMCLQEVDRFHELAEDFKAKGYSGIWKMRTGNPVDGCAIFWRTSRFNLLYEECIEFNKLGLRDNVAQICVLELINQNGSFPPSLTGSSKVVVGNIHVLYNPNRGEIKLGQVRVLLDKAKAISELWNNAPIVICGDFNCTPKSPLYNFISEQKLDLSGIDRDKVSGQASATILPPRRVGTNKSERSADGSVQVPSTEGDKEVKIGQDSSVSGMQNPETKNNSSENQHNHTVLDVSKSWTDMQCAKETDQYVNKDTQDIAVDNKIFNGVDHGKEESNTYYSESRLPIHHIDGEIHNTTPMTSSALETVHTDAAGMGSTEHKHISDAISSSNQESLSENSNLHDPKGNKHTQEEQSSRVNIDLEPTDVVNLKISSTQPSQISVSDAFVVPNPGYSESPSCEVVADDQMNSSSTSRLVYKSHQSTNIDFPLDEKLEKTFLDETDKTIIGSENVSEDDNVQKTAFHNAKGVALDLGPSVKPDFEKSYQVEELDSASKDLLLPAESNEVEDELSPVPISKSIDPGKTTYNPSLWTPMEIKTTAGNAECTVLEHPLLLRSTYTEATMNCSGTRDPHGEPLVTSYNRCFSGTVDYIWRSEGLQTTRVLAPIPKHAMEWTPGFPTKKWGSDHIALVSELAFLKEGSDISKDV